MDLLNLEVARVILHEVKRRTDDQIPPPDYGIELEELDEAALEELRLRVVAAMSRSDRCMQMAIRDCGPQSMTQLAARLVGSDDELFVGQSRGVADLLAVAQKSRGIPGGVTVVFSGTVGVPTRRFLAVIKAEVHAGFTREQHNGRLVLKYLDKLLLTPSMKLYKIGFFVEADPAAADLSLGWQAYIYDDAMTPKDKYGAAHYFYEGFLGLAFPESSARQTKQFHDWTKTYIHQLNVPEEDKVTLHNALVTYLKADQSPTVNVQTFADTYLGDAELRDTYRTFMAEKGFPRHAVPKDLADVSRSLKTRRITFRNQVKLIAPAEGFDNLISMETIDSDGIDDQGQWTKVIVKDRIRTQE
jgi:hypothetical protein